MIRIHNFKMKNIYMVHQLAELKLTYESRKRKLYYAYINWIRDSSRFS